VKTGRKPYNIKRKKTEEAAPTGTKRTEAKILKTGRTPISSTGNSLLLSDVHRIKFVSL
jgi:hypothetical protein